MMTELRVGLDVLLAWTPAMTPPPAAACVGAIGVRPGAIGVRPNYACVCRGRRAG
jgi:hypothetical protein